MEVIIKKYRQPVTEFLQSFLSEKESSLKDSNYWALDLTQKLAKFSVRGKMVRPCLLCFSFEMFSSSSIINPVKAGAALELFQSGILIHDDIMDRDLLRRGESTVHAQYQQLAKKLKLPEPELFGINMGICVGDASFFYTYEILSELNISSETKSRLISMYSRVFFGVGSGQMQDISLGLKSSDVSENEIIGIMRDKTSHYSVALPLCAGAILAEQPQETINLLYKIGENIGIIFQIRDDELGVFGDPNVTGKPVGADIREGKKTLLYFYLFENDNNKQLRKLFGKQNITEKEVEFVRQSMREAKVLEKIQERVDQYRRETIPLVDKLKVSKENKKKLIEILEFCAARQK